MTLVFEEGCLISGDTLIKLSILKLSITFSGHDLTELDVVISLAFGLFNTLVTCLDTLIVIFLLKIYGSFIRVESDFLRALVNGLLVKFKSILKVLLLVEVISLCFQGLGILFVLQFVPLFLRK
jgi:hypothetical protein